MEALNLSLLFAISVPVAAILALQVWLALNGERGTLLMPSTGAYEPTHSPALVLSAMVGASAKARMAEKARLIEAANDAVAHEAA